jgi:hypothetical protein
MRRVSLLAFILGLFATSLASEPAYAQATRTWVSGVGDDANPCSRTAPCKTFAGAISKTAAGGFGALTITKSITLNCSATLGSVLVAGTNGINIAAGAADRVVLRGIQIQGVNSGLVGVKITAAAAVSIEDCVITQFTQQGINDARTSGGTELYVRNTIISHNTGNGISLVATVGNKASIEGSSVINNESSGIGIITLNNAMITRSVISGNLSNGVATDAGSVVSIDSTSITANATGIAANGTLMLSNSNVTLNTTGFSGTTSSYGNNRLQGNGTFGSAVTGISLQ